MFNDLEFLIIAIVIGIVVSIVLEFVVKMLWSDLDAQKINLLSVFMGWLLGVVAMIIFSGDFVTYSVLGLAGGVWSPGIYDIIVKGLKLKGGDVDGY